MTMQMLLNHTERRRPRGGGSLIRVAAAIAGSVKSSVGAALALALSVPALYSQTPPTPASAVDFGMIGLADSQTLRLSIIAFPPSPIYPPQPVCIAQLGFANSSGGPVGPTKTVNLGAGQGDF